LHSTCCGVLWWEICLCFQKVLLGEIREGPACTKARQDESQKQEADNSQMPATRTTAVQLSETNPARPSGTGSDEKLGRVPTAGSTRQAAGPGVGPGPRTHHPPNNSAAIMRPGDQIPGAARPSPRNRANAAPHSTRNRHKGMQRSAPATGIGEWPPSPASIVSSLEPRASSRPCSPRVTPCRSQVPPAAQPPAARRSIGPGYSPPDAYHQQLMGQSTCLQHWVVEVDCWGPCCCCSKGGRPNLLYVCRAAHPLASRILDVLHCTKRL
jgi:hypothetical protein